MRVFGIEIKQTFYEKLASTTTEKRQHLVSDCIKRLGTRSSTGLAIKPYIEHANLLAVTGLSHKILIRTLNLGKLQTSEMVAIGDGQ